jgi:hypothetical protein
MKNVTFQLYMDLFFRFILFTKLKSNIGDNFITWTLTPKMPHPTLCILFYCFVHETQVTYWDQMAPIPSHQSGWFILVGVRNMGCLIGISIIGVKNHHHVSPVAQQTARVILMVPNCIT